MSNCGIELFTICVFTRVMLTSDEFVHESLFRNNIILLFAMFEEIFVLLISNCEQRPNPTMADPTLFFIVLLLSSQLNFLSQNYRV